MKAPKEGIQQIVSSLERKKREREIKEKGRAKKRQRGGGRCEGVGGRERQMTERGEAKSF